MELRIALRRQKAKFVTSEFVLLEFADGCCSLPLRTNAITFLEGIKQLPDLEITPLSSELLAKGWNLYSHRLDQDWSLTDCTSFSIMKQHRIMEAFTMDHHFEQAGFVKLL